MAETAKKKVVLLGATGSIGGSTLRVLREHADRLELIGVAAHSSHAALAAICHEFNVPHATLSSEAAYAEANAANNFPANTQLGCGDAGLLEISTLAEADIVLVAVVGPVGSSRPWQPSKQARTLRSPTKSCSSSVEPS